MTPLKALVFALLQLHPREVVYDSAEEHALAAQAAAEEVDREEVTPEILLAISYNESRFHRVAATYVSPTGERRGMWLSRRRPPGHGPYFCGSLGSPARSWAGCVRLMDDLAGSYLTAARGIGLWLDQPVCSCRRGAGRLRCALLGYGGGYPMIRSGGPYPSRTMQRARNIRALRERLQNTQPDKGV